MALNYCNQEKFDVSLPTGGARKDAVEGKVQAQGDNDRYKSGREFGRARQQLWQFSLKC